MNEYETCLSGMDINAFGLFSLLTMYRYSNASGSQIFRSLLLGCSEEDIDNADGYVKSSDIRALIFSMADRKLVP